MTEAVSYSCWNLIPQHLDPTLVHIGSFPVRWYGLMYLAAFFTCYQVMWAAIQRDHMKITKEDLDKFASWLIAGILVGARLGYVLFYNLGYYIHHPLEAVLPFSFDPVFHFTGISGMSFHGGLIGSTLFGTYCILKNKWSYWEWNSLAFMATPLGYTWGRMGNFINGELYGRVTDAPIGMLFPMDKTQHLRHPSQLYEMTFEGLILFAILQWLYRKPGFRPHMMALYLLGYGTFRFFIEFFREPDAQIGLNALGLSRGQLLCMGMILAAVILWLVRHRKLAKSGGL
ncbi:MAG TPA: prolipoprotein diacylglyceryl transferase [Fibrobacteraceae bacterium]|nr:prolipoprotein diacylglyceryl transferase [Fibrobacteraceae bacterium]